MAGISSGRLCKIGMHCVDIDPRCHKCYGGFRRVTFLPPPCSFPWPHCREAESRLPKFRESPCIKSFRFGAKGKGQQLPWERLPLFGSCVPSGRDCCHLTFYPGGAVWASAWCPMAPGPGGHHKPAVRCCRVADPALRCTWLCQLTAVWPCGSVNQR